MMGHLDERHLVCHQGESANSHHVTVRNDYPEFSDCASCHSGMVEPVNCVDCHTASSWGTSGSAQARHHGVADSNNISCSTCHSSIVPASGCSSTACHGNQWPTGAPNLHHETATRNTYGFSCLDCHDFNGTFLKPETGQMVFVHRNQIVLQGAGRIRLGEPVDEGGAFDIEYATGFDDPGAGAGSGDQG